MSTTSLFWSNTLLYPTSKEMIRSGRVGDRFVVSSKLLLFKAASLVVSPFVTSLLIVALKVFTDVYVYEFSRYPNPSLIYDKPPTLLTLPLFTKDNASKSAGNLKPFWIDARKLCFSAAV